MIRDVVIHLDGEQPLLADFEALPSPTDAALVCTNVRLRNGRAPRFADDSGSWFLFPLHHVRFVEVPPRPVEEASDDATSAQADAAACPATRPEPADLEVDEDFLRRVRNA